MANASSVPVIVVFPEFIFPPWCGEYRPVRSIRYNCRAHQPVMHQVPSMSQSLARHLNLAGASNFRDLGGYVAQDGRTVRWRKLFRSNHLGHLTSADPAMLRRLGAKTAFHLRGKDERSEPLSGLAHIQTHALPLEPPVVPPLRPLHQSARMSTADDALQVMRD